jgi:Phage portal protein, SPP1 Gp6-like
VVTALERLSAKLDVATSSLVVLDSYYAGTQPLSFLSPEAAKALGNRLRALAINFPRLSVDVLAERLRVEGFRTNGGTDLALWQSWVDNGMGELQNIVHTECLALGSSYVTVWAAPSGQPAITIDSARETTVERDPVTRAVTAAAHRWLAEDRAQAVLFERHAIGLYESIAAVPADSMLGAGQGYPQNTMRQTVTVPLDGWVLKKEIANPLGVVPVVPFVNRGRLVDVDGVSEMANILDTSDALNKITADMLVASEYTARPRRFATGIEVEEEPVLDGAGQPTGETVEVSPFGEGPERVWTSESPESRFGEFPGSNLAGYTSAVSILTNQIGALSGLPPHMLGVHQDQPASAEAIRSAESGLVQRAIARQRTFGRSWSEVAALISMVATGTRPTSVQPVWASPETFTPSQAADAASKLVAAGIVPVAQALDDLGYSPEQIAAMQKMRSRDAMMAAIAGANVLPRTAP